jgi:hypothetical protein
VLQQKMLSMSSSGKCFDVKFEPSPQLVDFLEACFVSTGDLTKVAKVSPGGAALQGKTDLDRIHS